MNSFKKTDLKSKFGKFAVSTEKMAKVNGADWLIAAENMDDLQALVDRDGGHCTAV
ncbi:hypothetical protein Fleli_2712 [Bernardetia litoralis DSM 6794]|uniref:Uncharacterized protein n=1 Tax=Bernardetia litoralis (strain ATCC 23117 / DSM 6794 / NBRC 15988 / NCIMB 1366 / Fx l1 / Sio-4) TaxID=880071 RepID=I4AM83_BERLS|nr:hypothetical protein [Bernardetia litoralis]AFM05068.1 hypothetical protein Fleli_2712 [Bernardetia litoralis DSM 6794]